MREFVYRRATNEADAIAAAASGYRYIAGGTTLVDLMREEVENPGRIVDINRLPLDYIRVGDREITIGSLTRMADVAAHPEVKRLHPLISETLVEGASPQLRNAASIGGNLLQRVRCPYFRMLEAPCNKRSPGSGCSAFEGLNVGTAILGTSDHCVATHPSDLAVSLVAFDATVKLKGPQGERSVAVGDLYRLPGDSPHREHNLLPGELIIEVSIPLSSSAASARYLKVRDRSSYEFALVSAAAALQVEGGTIAEARVAAGGVGTVPWRMSAVEAALVGRKPTREVFEQAAQASIEGVKEQSGNGFKTRLLPPTILRALELTRENS
jgi:xanthine dehydrogenase YagS FAD-binding subunit